ncbi:MAG: integral rane protein [Gemmatimonadetes bacterium]|nr:integral rane protein [Gemmatimonadota bacterium]
MTAGATGTAGRLTAAERLAVARRGELLSRLTLAYNTCEGIAAIVAGILAGSIALVGFGIDSAIEVISSVASLWRLHHDANLTHRARSERIALRIVGSCFLALAVYIACDSGRALLVHEVPQRTLLGVVITMMSVVIMPLLARGKRRVAVSLGSRALAADATQTSLCAYLSLIVLTGLLLNVVLGWWWADPVAALAMVPIIAKEGIEGVRGETSCDDCS